MTATQAPAMRVACERRDLRELVGRLCGPQPGSDLLVRLEARGERLLVAARTATGVVRGYGFLADVVAVTAPGRVLVPADELDAALASLPPCRLVLERRTAPARLEIRPEGGERASASTSLAGESSPPHPRPGRPRLRLVRPIVVAALAAALAAGAAVAVERGLAPSTAASAAPHHQWFWPTSLAEQRLRDRYGGPDQRIAARCRGRVRLAGGPVAYRRFSCRLSAGGQHLAYAAVTVVAVRTWRIVCRTPCAPTRAQQRALYALVAALPRAARSALARRAPAPLRRLAHRFETWRARYRAGPPLERLAAAADLYARLAAATLRAPRARAVRAANRALATFRRAALATAYFRVATGRQTNAKAAEIGRFRPANRPIPAYRPGRAET